MTPSNPRPHLSCDALAGLLARLAAHPQDAGEEYEAIRARLIGFFGRRAAIDADSLADRTIDRVARKIQGGEQVEHVRAYFFGVAKKLWLEYAKHKERERAALRLAITTGYVEAPDFEAGDEETRMACLDCCLAALPPETRDVIVDYYRGPGKCQLEDREGQAKSLGLRRETLRKRTSRIRAHLARCLEQCLAGTCDACRTLQSD